VHSAEKSAGQVKVGAVVSCTVTVNMHIAEFGGDAWSDAVHVTIVIPNPKIDPEGGTHVTRGDGSQRSVAVAMNVAGAPIALVHSFVMSAGHVIIGGVVSVTVTMNEQVEAGPLLPVASVAVQLTVVGPIGNVSPLVGVHTIVGFGSHASVAVTMNITAAPCGLVHSSNRSSGHEIVGPTVSWTVTSNMQPLELLCASVAVHITVVVPMGKRSPLCGLHTIIGAASQTSDADTMNVTVAPDALVHSAVIGPGHMMIGSVRSVTVTVNVHSCWPQLSLPVQFTLVIPNGNTLPDGGVQVMPDPSKLTPWHVGNVGEEKLTVAPFGLSHSTSMEPGQINGSPPARATEARLHVAARTNALRKRRKSMFMAAPDNPSRSIGRHPRVQRDDEASVIGPRDSDTPYRLALLDGAPRAARPQAKARRIVEIAARVKAQSMRGRLQITWSGLSSQGPPNCPAICIWCPAAKPDPTTRWKKTPRIGSSASNSTQPDWR
jgi:hypothetical protein